jgi:hypothetical protein
LSSSPSEWALGRGIDVLTPPNWGVYGWPYSANA